MRSCAVEQSARSCVASAARTAWRRDTCPGRRRTCPAALAAEMVGRAVVLGRHFAVAGSTIMPHTGSRTLSPLPPAGAHDDDGRPWSSPKIRVAPLDAGYAPSHHGKVKVPFVKDAKMQIGEASKATGVSAKMIRHYEVDRADPRGRPARHQLSRLRRRRCAPARLHPPRPRPRLLDRRNPRAAAALGRPAPVEPRRQSADPRPYRGARRQDRAAAAKCARPSPTWPMAATATTAPIARSSTSLAGLRHRHGRCGATIARLDPITQMPLFLCRDSI